MNRSVKELFVLIFVTLLFSVHAAIGTPLPGEKVKFFFNVIEFGAIGDGVSDDALAFQLAITAANKAGGGNIVVPTPLKFYRIVRPIRMMPNVHIVGEGKAHLYLDGSKIFTNGASNIRLENLKFEGNDKLNYCLQINADPRYSAIAGKNVITNNIFTNCKMGIFSAHFARDVTIENNRFDNNIYGLYLHNIDSWKIINNVFSRSVRPVETHNAHNTLVKNNTISGTKSATIVGILFATNVGLDSDGPSNNIITGNVISDIAEEGILLEEIVANAHLDGGRVSSVSTRTLSDSNKVWSIDGRKNREVVLVDGTGAGQWREIVSNSSDTLSIDKSWEIQPDRTTKYVIVKAIKNNVISRNVVSNTGRMGIEIYGPSLDNLIEDNSVNDGGTNIGYSGIALVGTSGQGGKLDARHPATGNTVKGNTVMGGNKAGIHLYQVNYIKPDFYNRNNRILQNSVTKASTGILVQRSRNTKLESNTISSVSIGIKEDNESDFTEAIGNSVTDFTVRDIILSGAGSSFR